MSTSQSPHLLEFSPEILLAITSSLSLPEKRSLLGVCRTLYNLLVLDVLFGRFQTMKQEKTVFLVDNASRGEVGYEPFIITNVHRTRVDVDEHSSGAAQSGSVIGPGDQRLLIDIYYPKFMRNDNESHRDRNNWEIHIHMNELSLSSETQSSQHSSGRIKSIDYEVLSRGDLLKASGGLLRALFECPECRGSRDVCPGCGGFSLRFSELFTSCGWPMPCPVCIGYGVADYAKGIQDDKKKLDKLWKKIDAMLAKDEVRYGREVSKSESSED